jgi:hypothetical protein
MAWSLFLISRWWLMNLLKLALWWRLRGTVPAGSRRPPGPVPPGEQQVADRRDGDAENHPRHQHDQVTGGHGRSL